MAGPAPHIFEARREALLATAQREGVSNVVIFGFGSALGAGTLSHGHLRFFSGWDGHESLSLLVLGAGVSQLIVGSPFMLALAQATRPDLNARYVHPTGWPQALRDGLGGAAFAALGFGEMPAQIEKSLSALGVIPALSLDEAAARQRLVKDAASLALMREAAGLCDELFARLGAELAARRPAWEAQLNLETHARRQGADYCRTWLTTAPAADYPRYWPQEAQRTPERGDQVLFGIALTVEGHWGHGIRMGSIGPQRSTHAALARQVEAMLKAGVSALRPGLPLAGVEAAMEDVFASRLARENAGRFRRFRNGHGLGASYEEPLATNPFRQHFDPAAQAAPGDITLAPGMVFELHPNIFVSDLGGAALGEMMLVTDEEPEFLLRFPSTCQVWE
ncbi:MAG: M24 family metallopeptidase [Proteobacteria bacterium]|nr:M24 family metallopeptidase [Pseudomonadota bacterium]